MKKNDSSKSSDTGVFKKAVTGVYETNTFNDFLKDGIHPGGFPLTERVAELAAPDKWSMILDIACGKGVGCVHLAEKYGCRVIGIDMSANKISEAHERGKTKGVDSQTSFTISDAESLPFAESVFDIVISECSFSILPNKEKAVQGIWRVLKPGGKFIMIDVVRKENISDPENDSLHTDCHFPLIPCIAGARTLPAYIKMFNQAGFKIIHVEDHSMEMKKLGYKIALAFGGWEGFIKSLSSDLISTTNIPKQDATIRCSLETYRDIFKKIKLSYALVTMRKRQTTGFQPANNT